MADDDTHLDMTKVARRVHGPRPIAALVPAVARAAFKNASPGVAQLMEAWAEIVGASLAAVTVPRRLVQGTLTINCSGPVAMELQHLSSELTDRINQYLGARTVRQLRFLQNMPARSPARPRLPPAKAVEEAASAAVSHLPEGPLRSALAALGRAVLTESASRLGK
jgi:hypothetical protein